MPNDKSNNEQTDIEAIKEFIKYILYNQPFCTGIQQKECGWHVVMQAGDHFYVSTQCFDNELASRLYYQKMITVIKVGMNELGSSLVHTETWFPPHTQN